MQTVTKVTVKEHTPISTILGYCACGWGWWWWVRVVVADEGGIGEWGPLCMPVLTRRYCLWVSGLRAWWWSVWVNQAVSSESPSDLCVVHIHNTWRSRWIYLLHTLPLKTNRFVWSLQVWSLQGRFVWSHTWLPPMVSPLRVGSN